MQKVEGSSPFSRSQTGPRRSPGFVARIVSLDGHASLYNNSVQQMALRRGRRRAGEVPLAAKLEKNAEQAIAIVGHCNRPPSAQRERSDVAEALAASSGRCYGKASVGYFRRTGERPAGHPGLAPAQAPGVAPYRQDGRPRRGSHDFDSAASSPERLSVVSVARSESTRGRDDSRVVH